MRNKSSMASSPLEFESFESAGASNMLSKSSVAGSLFAGALFAGTFGSGVAVSPGNPNAGPGSIGDRCDSPGAGERSGLACSAAGLFAPAAAAALAMPPVAVCSPIASLPMALSLLMVVRGVVIVASIAGAAFVAFGGNDRVGMRLAGVGAISIGVEFMGIVGETAMPDAAGGNAGTTLLAGGNGMGLATGAGGKTMPPGIDASPPWCDGTCRCTAPGATCISWSVNESQASSQPVGRRFNFVASFVFNCRNACLNLLIRAGWLQPHPASTPQTGASVVAYPTRGVAHPHAGVSHPHAGAGQSQVDASQPHAGSSHPQSGPRRTIGLKPSRPRNGFKLPRLPSKPVDADLGDTGSQPHTASPQPHVGWVITTPDGAQPPHWQSPALAEWADPNPPKTPDPGARTKVAATTHETSRRGEVEFAGRRAIIVNTVICGKMDLSVGIGRTYRLRPSVLPSRIGIAGKL